MREKRRRIAVEAHTEDCGEKLGILVGNVEKTRENKVGEMIYIFFPGFRVYV